MTQKLDNQICKTVALIADYHGQDTIYLDGSTVKDIVQTYNDIKSNPIAVLKYYIAESYDDDENAKEIIDALTRIVEWKNKFRTYEMYRTNNWRYRIMPVAEITDMLSTFHRKSIQYIVYDTILGDYVVDEDGNEKYFVDEIYQVVGGMMMTCLKFKERGTDEPLTAYSFDLVED